MTDMRKMLGTTLFKQLDKLRETKGGVTVEDAGMIIEQFMQSRNDTALTQEIAKMVKDIEDAKNEILALSSNSQTNKKAMSDASLHLDTVIKSTEEATNNFLDAANEIQKLAEGIGGKKEEDLKAVCTRIYESCSFQDLASQRITKVIKLIQTLESHIMNLLKLFAIPVEATESTAAVGSVTLPADDRQLLNGPQLPGNAASQGDIDALFQSLKGGN